MAFGNSRKQIRLKRPRKKSGTPLPTPSQSREFLKTLLRKLRPTPTFLLRLSSFLRRGHVNCITSGVLERSPTTGSVTQGSSSHFDLTLLTSEDPTFATPQTSRTDSSTGGGAVRRSKNRNLPKFVSNVVGESYFVECPE